MSFKKWFKKKKEDRGVNLNESVRYRNDSNSYWIKDFTKYPPYIIYLRLDRWLETIFRRCEMENIKELKQSFAYFLAIWKLHSEHEDNLIKQFNFYLNELKREKIIEENEWKEKLKKINKMKGGKHG